MKTVKLKLKVSDKEFFDTLFKSSLLEAEDKTGEKFDYQSALEKGYKYTSKKKSGKKFIDITVHIRKPIINKNIHINSDYPNIHFEMDYQIEKIDDESCYVIYSQSDSRKKDDTAGFFFNMAIKNRFSKIEKYIIGQRNKKD